MEKQFAGQRFRVNLTMTIDVDVLADTKIYEAMERLQLMLDNYEREDGQRISAHLVQSQLEDWNVTNVTDLYWVDGE